MACVCVCGGSSGVHAAVGVRLLWVHSQARQSPAPRAGWHGPVLGLFPHDAEEPVGVCGRVWSSQCT